MLLLWFIVFPVWFCELYIMYALVDNKKFFYVKQSHDTDDPSLNGSITFSLPEDTCGSPV